MAAAEAAPPKGGLLAVHKPMKLPGDERRNSFGPKSAPLLCAGGEIVVCGVPAGFTGWLLRRALAQYSRLVFSVLDGLRAGGHLVGTSGARIAKGHRNTQRNTRPLRRHPGDCLCRHFRHVAVMAVVSDARE
jgi:hypothetical protein